MSLKEKGAKGVFWTLIESILIQGLSFVTAVFLTRVLAPDDFGLVGLVTVFMVIGQAVIEGGLGSSLIRDNTADETDFSTVFYGNIGISVIIYALIYLCAPFIAQFFEDERLIELVRILGLGFIISGLSIVQQKLLIKDLQFKRLTLLRLPGVILGSAIALIFAYNGFGVWSLVIRDLATRFINLIAFWIKSGWYPRWVFDKAKFRTHFDFGYKLVLTSILGAVFKEIYALVIGKQFSVTTLGFYNRASKYNQLPRKVLTNVISKTTFPLLSKIQDEKEKISAIYQSLLRAVFFLIAPVILTTAAVAEPLFTFLLTDKWLESVPYFQIISLASLMYPLHAYNLNVFKIYGRTDLTLKLAVYKNGLVVIVVLVGIVFGMTALLWGMVASSYISFFLNSWYSEQMINYKTSQQVKDLLPTLLTALVGAFIGLKLVNYLNESTDLVRIIAGGTVSILFFIVSNRLFKNKGWNDFLSLSRSMSSTLLGSKKKD